MNWRLCLLVLLSVFALGFHAGRWSARGIAPETEMEPPAPRAPSTSAPTAQPKPKCPTGLLCL